MILVMKHCDKNRINKLILKTFIINENRLQNSRNQKTFNNDNVQACKVPPQVLQYIQLVQVSVYPI